MPPRASRALIPVEGHLAGLTLQGLADEQRRAELERQAIALGLKGHVDGCVEGQKRIERRFDDMENRFDKIDACLKVVSDAQISAASAAASAASTRAEMAVPKWWQPWVGRLAWGAVSGGCGLIIALGTMAINDRAQIASLQNQNRPAATVTVSPPSVVTQPAPAATSAGPPGLATPVSPADDGAP